MLPQPIFSFENFIDLDTIIELKKVQKQVTYFCTRPLYYKVPLFIILINGGHRVYTKSNN